MTTIKAVNYRRKEVMCTEQLKHVSPKFFYTHELLGKEVTLKYVESNLNTVDIFTNVLGPAPHRPFWSEQNWRPPRALPTKSLATGVSYHYKSPTHGIDSWDATKGQYPFSSFISYFLFSILNFKFLVTNFWTISPKFQNLLFYLLLHFILFCF